MARKKKPIKILTLDTETYNGLIGKLKRIAIYDGENITYEYSFLAIEPYIIKWKNNGYDVHVYIHNMEFDLRKLEGLFHTDRIVWEKSFVINNRLAKVTTKDYTLHDSFKLLPMSLAKLSHDFDIEHGKLDLWEEVQKTYPKQYKDIVDFLDRCDIDDELYLRYLGYDVISLYEIIMKIIDISGLSDHDFVGRLSTASLSRFIFKNGYKGKVFKADDTFKSDYEFLSSYNFQYNLEVEEFIRNSYCGGRTEVFKPKLETKGFHYDVNSLYPSVMINGDYPIGKPEFYTDSEMSKHYFNEWLDNKMGLGFLCCTVYVPLQHIPPLPVKMGKLAFPCGWIYGTFTFEELEFAINECGCEIKEYHEVCFFKRTYPVFQNFVSEFYKLKEQATEEKNDSLRSFAKLLLNVGYGYTGMRRDDKTTLKSIDKIEDFETVVFANELEGYIEIPTDIRAEYIQVQIASYVTSRARLVLLKALRQAEMNGAEVYYCDTDSIVTDKPFDSSIVDSKKLGFWDLESEPLKALFLRPKVYAEMLEKKTNVKFKGISKETQNSLTFDSYETLYHDLEEMKKEYEVIEKNKLLMKSIMVLEKNGLSLDSYEYRDKKMNFDTVEKRIVNYVSNYTKPLYFKTVDEFRNFSFSRGKKKVTFSLSQKGE